MTRIDVDNKKYQKAKRAALLGHGMLMMALETLAYNIARIKKHHKKFIIMANPAFYKELLSVCQGKPPKYRGVRVRRITTMSQLWVCGKYGFTILDNKPNG